MRAALDRLYLAAAWIAAACILAIALLVSAQILLNLGTRVFGLPLPATIPSYADFSGFLLAASTFLALPYTLRSGGHIRVSLVTARLSGRARWAVELVVLAVATGFAIFATWKAAQLTLESLHYGDVSPGIVPVALWIPQSVMTLGLALFALALADSLAGTAKHGAPVIRGGEEV